MTDRYPPFYEGGYELNCHQVTEGLRTRGHTLLVLTTAFGLKARAVDGHIQRILHSHDRSERRGLSRRTIQVQQSCQTLQNYWIARRLAEQVKPDLAFVWHMLAASILPILAMQDLGIPTVFRIGSHWLLHCKEECVDEGNRLKKWYRSGLMGFRRFEELEFDAAIIVTETLKQSYQQAGFDIENAVVIPNGIPGEWIRQQSPRCRSHNEPMRLLYAGRLEANKGPDVAIKAVEHLVKVRGHRNVCLDLVGDGQSDYVDKLKQLITSSGLQDVVRLAGFWPRSELVHHYAQYDLLLFTTPRWEGFGTTIVEAMAQGLTVIASDIGGPRDIIEDGRNGLLVAPNEPIELADAIEKIISAPSLAAELGSAAIRTVRQKYTRDSVLDQYETFLESVTGRYN